MKRKAALDLACATTKDAESDGLAVRITARQPDGNVLKVYVYESATTRGQLVVNVDGDLDQGALLVVVNDRVAFG